MLDPVGQGPVDSTNIILGYDVLGPEMYEKNTRLVIKHDFSGVQNKPKIQQIFISQKLVSS